MPFVIAALAVICVASVGAQPPRLTFDYPAMARRLVQQLALKPGERVMSLTHPGFFDDLVHRRPQRVEVARLERIVDALELPDVFPRHPGYGFS